MQIYERVGIGIQFYKVLLVYTDYLDTLYDVLNVEFRKVESRIYNEF